MPEDALRYDCMVEEALRTVVGRALNHAAEHGLPGEHHFYITFRTTFPGVDLPEALKERYPNEMTIVLQHQFWDLEVRDESFSVTLSFADVLHALTVPFEAVAAFADPSVRFGLQFDVSGTEPAEQAETASEPGQPLESAPDAAETEDTKSKIVTLDAFRKK